MDARKGNIFEILNGNRQYIIPVYQRFYSWDVKQCERLWNDIVEMQEQNKDGHFVGSIVNIAEQAMPTGVQKYMIIDGQQRITTLTLMLLALRDYSLINPEDMSINARRIDNMMLKNEYEDGDERYKLLLTKKDRASLISLVDQIPYDKHENSKIFTNYKYFYEKILKGELQPVEVYESIGKLQIVNITLDRSVDDAQAIFESLNSTGKELTESDLIRNYILMGLEPEEQRSIYDRIWRPMELLFEADKQEVIMDKFFRDYLTFYQTRIPNMANIYEDFKKFHLNCKFETMKELCEDLYKFAVYYTDMVFVKSDNPKVKELYEDIKNLKMEVVYPFLMNLQNDYKNDVIEIETLVDIIKLCINYVLRRSICGMPTNSLNKTFATFKNSIVKDDYLNSVKANFIKFDSYKEFPTDEKFINDFVKKDIYNMRTRNYILSKLENHDNKASVKVENLTIEHILPQNQNLSENWKSMLGENWKETQKTYLHTIGNLTLTAYNSEMSDRPFEEKMNIEGGFKQSALRINGYVVMQDTWNSEKIKERAEILGQKALSIWEYPQLTPEELEPYIREEVVETTYSIETYSPNETNLTLFNAIDKRILNLSPSIRKEFKKHYIAYKLETNFVDIIFLSASLRLIINMKFDDVLDPLGLCRDVTNIGRWGNGDVEINFKSLDDIDKVMDIIKQSLDKQLNGVDHEV